MAPPALVSVCPPSAAGAAPPAHDTAAKPSKASRRPAARAVRRDVVLAPLLPAMRSRAPGVGPHVADVAAQPISAGAASGHARRHLPAYCKGGINEQPPDRPCRDHQQYRGLQRCHGDLPESTEPAGQVSQAGADRAEHGVAESEVHTADHCQHAGQRQGDPRRRLMNVAIA